MDGLRQTMGRARSRPPASHNSKTQDAATTLSLTASCGDWMNSPRRNRNHQSCLSYAAIPKRKWRNGTGLPKKKKSREPFPDTGRIPTWVICCRPRIAFPRRRSISLFRLPGEWRTAGVRRWLRTRRTGEALSIRKTVCRILPACTCLTPPPGVWGCP